MFRQKPFLAALGLLLLIGVVGPLLTQAQLSKAASFADPWLHKPVLPYLLLTQDERLETEAQALFNDLGLSAEEKEAFTKIAVEEQQQLRALYEETQPIVQDDALSMADKQEAIHDSQYNDRVAAALGNTDDAVHRLLGARYAVFRDWIGTWWLREQEAYTDLKQPEEQPGIESDASSCFVFATQYAGYTNYEVALPDKYVKWANLGWDWLPRPPWYYNPPYTVNIYRGGYWVWSVLVREVGPWNIDDNYWDRADGYNPRRMFTDIPLCHSEAEYAYYYNYNGGKDQFGRTVLNPASVDLTPSVAADLGLGYLQNAWVRVYYYDLP